MVDYSLIFQKNTIFWLGFFIDYIDLFLRVFGRIWSKKDILLFHFGEKILYSQIDYISNYIYIYTIENLNMYIYNLNFEGMQQLSRLDIRFL